MSVPISQFIPPSFSPLGVHTFVLYVCVSISALMQYILMLFFNKHKTVLFSVSENMNLELKLLSSVLKTLLDSS